LRFAGLEHVPERGGALIASNHVSVLDPVFVVLAASERGRMVRYLTVSDAFDQRVVGWALRRVDQIPLRRGMGDWAAIDEVAAIVRAGALAGISAEGTVGEGRALLPIQKGAARIALAAGVPIIPTAVWGTQARWSISGPHLGAPARPAVTVAFGPPIEPAGDPRSRADVRAQTDQLAEALGTLVDSVRSPGRRLAIEPSSDQT